MTQLMAFFMVTNAQAYIAYLMPRYRPITEEPALYAAYQTLDSASRSLGAELLAGIDALLTEVDAGTEIRQS